MRTDTKANHCGYYIIIFLIIISSSSIIYNIITRFGRPAAGIAAVTSALKSLRRDGGRPAALSYRARTDFLTDGKINSRPPFVPPTRPAFK